MLYVSCFFCFFFRQKICKENAWSLTLIDNMANLCRNHHNTLKNFQIIGSTLDATSKIYGLRVDSVHSDVLRMTSGLGRFRSNFIYHIFFGSAQCRSLQVANKNNTFDFNFPSE